MKNINLITDKQLDNIAGGLGLYIVNADLLVDGIDNTPMQAFVAFGRISMRSDNIDLVL